MPCLTDNIRTFVVSPMVRKSAKNKVLVPPLYLGCSKYLGANDG